MAGRTCSSGCPEPPERTVPLWVIAVWRAWETVTWPRTARQLKRAGFRRTGWMTWESGPDGGPDG
jgi:hypothetical protein